ncbi:hypothetical protein EDB19DRAFT_1709044 [Suillus lakei]|nr:hypothetical protein EDB19DRAFT_1709044 [Suillus lakei]
MFLALYYTSFALLDPPSSSHCQPSAQPLPPKPRCTSLHHAVPNLNLSLCCPRLFCRIYPLATICWVHVTCAYSLQCPPAAQHAQPLYFSPSAIPVPSYILLSPCLPPF